MAWAIFAAPLANHLVTYPEAPATAAGLVAVAWLEERESPESFGGRYADQRRRVPMFIPRPGSD